MDVTDISYKFMNGTIRNILTYDTSEPRKKFQGYRTGMLLQLKN